jgi:sugar/nucleoside kinase (ribokinase family)
MPPAPLDVLSVGEMYVDLIMSGFDTWPQPGREAVASHFHREIGGGAAITACGLARLGTKTGVLGVAGRDDGAWLVEQLRGCGVNTSWIRFDPAEPTAFSVAASTSEDRAFLTYPGANRSLPATLAEAAAEGSFAGARHVHLACAPDLGTIAGLLDLMRRDGRGLSLDVGWHEDWLRDRRALAALSQVDIFFPNEVEALTITGEADAERALRRFASAGLTRVALKLGACGAALLWDGELLFAAPLAVKPVDTTGAGDCFNAGFLHALLAGERPDVCLQTANICGALSTQAYGGVAGLPDAARLDRELKRQS